MKQIDVLPNDVLLEIFDFYLTMDPLYAAATEIEPHQENPNLLKSA
jgi:hypothetical protein